MKKALYKNKHRSRVVFHMSSSPHHPKHTCFSRQRVTTRVTLYNASVHVRVSSTVADGSLARLHIQSSEGCSELHSSHSHSALSRVDLEKSSRGGGIVPLREPLVPTIFRRSQYVRKNGCPRTLGAPSLRAEKAYLAMLACMYYETGARESHCCCCCTDRNKNTPGARVCVQLVRNPRSFRFRFFLCSQFSIICAPFVSPRARSPQSGDFLASARARIVFAGIWISGSVE